MRRNWRCAVISVSTAVLLSGAASAAEVTHKAGDRVLALRDGTNSYFAATVKTASAEGGSVTFDDGTVQEYGPITWEPSLRAFEWAVGSRIECGADTATVIAVGDADSDKLTAGTIASLDSTTVELDAGGTKAKFPLSACRYHRTWWDELSERWRNYAKYAKAKSFPKARAKAPSADEVRASFDFALQSADGGGYIVLKKCVAVGKGWTKLGSGEEHTARTIDVACAIGIPLPPKPKENFACLIEYGTCRQAYQGNNTYGACEWSYSTKEPEQVDCKKVK